MTITHMSEPPGPSGTDSGSAETLLLGDSTDDRVGQALCASSEKEFELTDALVKKARKQVELQEDPAVVDSWTHNDYTAARGTAATKRGRKREHELELDALTRAAELSVHKRARIPVLKASLRRMARTEGIEDAGAHRRRRDAVKHEQKLAAQRADRERWIEYVKFDDERRNSPMAERAAWAKTMSTADLVIMGALVMSMLMVAAFTKTGVTERFPGLNWEAIVASYGLDAVFTSMLVTFMHITTRRARRGHKVNFWLLLPFEVFTVTVSVTLLVAPRLSMDSYGSSAWFFGIPAFGVTAALLVHLARTFAEVAETEKVRAEDQRRRAEQEALQERLRATEQWQRDNAIAVLDTDTLKLLADADEALACMALPVGDLQRLEPSRSENSDGLPSIHALQKWMELNGISRGGRRGAEQLRLMMGRRRERTASAS
ncbi:hypothetical protein AB0A63_31725 [Lentzea sp. NPDC042327]|uniref:hypothetical protein n=1 Tax=Lentzea sp. NPDC042327 TaxID=3154801 RepID=UPI003408A998